MGTPSLVKRLAKEARSGSDRTGSADVFGNPDTFMITPSLPPGGRMPPIKTSRRMKTSAFHPSAPRKGRQDVGSFRAVKTSQPTATRRQDAANKDQQKDENLGFSSFCPKERPTGCRLFP
jgi:hypothetical protein